MKTLGFAVAITLATALHAEEQPPLGGALIWLEPSHYDDRYESECTRMLREVYPLQDHEAAAYVACVQEEAEKSRLQALRALAWPNPPGRH